MSLGAYENELQKLRARGSNPDMELWELRAADCVPALKKKQLADWVITTFNVHDLDVRNSAFYRVWIQSASEITFGCYRV